MFRKKRYFSKNGFTLIELLVVIAIIGILAAVVMASLNNARAKARNSKRIQDMQQIKTALELYYSANGSYPACQWGSIHCSTVGVYEPMTTLGIVPTYLATLSNDPINTTKDGYLYGYYYGLGYVKTGDTTFTYTGLPTHYILGMRLENSGAATYSGWWNDYLNWLEGTKQ